MSLRQGNSVIAGGIQIDNTPTSGSSNAVSSGGVYTALGGKADIDASNFDATGKSTIAGFAMPSGTYDNLTAGATGTEYTAPANGYACLVAGSSSNGYVGLENTATLAGSGSRGAWQACFLAVKKNDIFRIVYDGSLINFTCFRFLYAQGEI